MPSLSDIFNPSFFMCLGILVLLTALIVVYFESKMREQNHKISSMLSLVSSLAEEQNNLRMEVFRMITVTNTNNHIINNSEAFQETKNNDLINVSDDEEDDSDEEDDDDSDSNDSDSNDSDSDSNDSDSDLEENEVIEIGNNNDIKVLKLNINKIDDNENDDNENNDFNINDLDDLDDELDDDSDSTSSDEELKEDIQNNLEELKDDESKETHKTVLTAFDLKQINISGLENETYDYKKFSLNKLKSLAMEKGLTKDSSKLKKNELLKLLGDK